MLFKQLKKRCTFDNFIFQKIKELLANKSNCVIGITGKSGSGKSTLAKTIAENFHGFHVDVDKIGHEALIEKVYDLEKVFGKENISTDNVFDRKKLGDLVFNNRHKMKQLNDIVWIPMKNRLNVIFNNQENKLLVVDWILLPHTEFWKQCDMKILIDMPFEVRLQRAIERDSITEQQFKDRDKNSISYSELDFDFIIRN